MSNDIPNLRNVAEMLVENGAVYVAVNKQSLVEEPVQIYYHIPAVVCDEQKEAIETYLAEEVGHRPNDRQLGNTRIADQSVPTAVWHVLHDDLHLYRRTPMYVDDGMAGLDSIEIEDGVAAVRETVATKPEIEPHPSETAVLEEVVRELADAGAASVEISHTHLIAGESPRIHLRIPMVPAEGQPIVGPIDSVQLDGERYPLRTTVTLDGPYGSSGHFTALYVGENVRGLNPVTVDEGMKSGRELIKQAADAETLQELEQSRV